MEIWLQNIFSGIVGSALTIFANIQINKFSTKRKTTAYLVLLLHEVNRHVFWLNALLKKPLNEVSQILTLIRNTENTEWNKTKYYLAETLSNEKFFIIQNHYYNIEAFKKILEEVQEQRHITRIPEEILHNYLQPANNALALLCSETKFKPYI